jgi:hypothetical protein
MGMLVRPTSTLPSRCITHYTPTCSLITAKRTSQWSWACVAAHQIGLGESGDKENEGVRAGTGLPCLAESTRPTTLPQPAHHGQGHVDTSYFRFGLLTQPFSIPPPGSNTERAPARGDCLWVSRVLSCCLPAASCPPARPSPPTRGQHNGMCYNEEADEGYCLVGPLLYVLLAPQQHFRHHPQCFE